MCLIIDFKFLNWHLMRLKRVINIPPHAECSQAVELFSITNTSNYSSKSINLEWGELICLSLLSAFWKGVCSLPAMGSHCWANGNWRVIQTHFFFLRETQRDAHVCPSLIFPYRIPGFCCKPCLLPPIHIHYSFKNLISLCDFLVKDLKQISVHTYQATNVNPTSLSKLSTIELHPNLYNLIFY